MKTQIFKEIIKKSGKPFQTSDIKVNTPMITAGEMIMPSCCCTAYYKCRICDADCSGSCFSRYQFNNKICGDCYKELKEWSEDND